MKISILMIFLLIFEGTITSIAGSFGYYDEFIILLIIILALRKVIINRRVVLKNNEALAIVIAGAFLAIGIISNESNHILTQKAKYLWSSIQSLKFILAFIFSKILFEDIKIDYRILEKVYSILNAISMFYVAVIIADIPGKFLTHYEKRFGFINTVSAGFSSPAELGFLAVCILSIQLFLIILLNKGMRSFIKVCINVFVILLFAGRTTAMVYFAGYIAILSLMMLGKNINLKQIMALIICGVYLARDRIISQMIDSDGARGLLYRTGVKIANYYFPLGSGFGTYGTDVSRKIYSPLYYTYGLSKKYGLSPDSPSFITDAHWAAILGETGWIGIALYSVCIILITYVIVKYSKNCKMKIAVSGVWFYGLIASMSDTILIAYRGVAIGVLTAYLIRILDSHNKNILTNGYLEHSNNDIREKSIQSDLNINNLI